MKIVIICNDFTLHLRNNFIFEIITVMTILFLCLKFTVVMILLLCLEFTVVTILVLY